MKSAHAIDEENEPALVHEHVVARRPLCAGCRIGHEMRDLARRLWAADIDDAQTVRKPGSWNLGAGDLLDRLMAGSGLRLRRAVERLDLESRNRHRPRLHGDIDDPEKRRWTGKQVEHVLRRPPKNLAGGHPKRPRHF